jgi:hypothetical protein
LRVSEVPEVPCVGTPRYIDRLIEFVALVTTLLKASSIVTAGCPVNTVLAVEEATPVGSVEKTSCEGCPGPDTEKLWLSAGTAASVPLLGFAVAVIVYWVAVVGGFELAS